MPLKWLENDLFLEVLDPSDLEAPKHRLFI